MKLLFGPSEGKQRELAGRLRALGIREADLIEEFVRGSGPGGQKINKASATVLLTHIPSGIQVRCQQGRSQALNRFYARRLLVEKLEERIYKEKSALKQKIEKIRRQKRKRSRRAKEKMLANKRRTGQIKAMRKKPALEP